jgi:hypothetical protein
MTIEVVRGGGRTDDERRHGGATWWQGRRRSRERPMGGGQGRRGEALKDRIVGGRGGWQEEIIEKRTLFEEGVTHSPYHTTGGTIGGTFSIQVYILIMLQVQLIDTIGIIMKYHMHHMRIIGRRQQRKPGPDGGSNH